MSSLPVEKRRYQRIILARPLAARMNSIKVFIIDISIIGVRVAHQEDLPSGRTHRLAFDYEGYSITYDCEVVRTVVDKPAKDPGAKTLYHSGIRLLKPIADSAVSLRNMIADHVMRALDEQKANARGVPPMTTIFQSGLKEKDTYTVYRFVRNEWQKTSSPMPQQPMDGFTVSAKEDPQQVAMLCSTYENSDFAGRKMIRAMAELSISPAESVPTRRYKP